MRVLVRGIPNFAYTETTSVLDIESFVQLHTLHLSDTYKVKVDYRNADNKRVMLYVEAIEENVEFIQERCNYSDSTSMRYLTLTCHEDGHLKSSGAASRVEVKKGLWYMIEPKRDARYPEKLKAFKEKQRLARIEIEKQEQLEEEKYKQLAELVDGIGVDAAIALLSSK